MEMRSREQHLHARWCKRSGLGKHRALPDLARAIRGRRIRQPGSFRDWSTVPGAVLRSKVLLTALCMPTTVIAVCARCEMNGCAWVPLFNVKELQPPLPAC